MVDVAQQTSHKTSKWWNYFFPEPLGVIETEKAEKDHSMRVDREGTP